MDALAHSLWFNKLYGLKETWKCFAILIATIKIDFPLKLDPTLIK